MELLTALFIDCFFTDAKLSGDLASVTFQFPKEDFILSARINRLAFENCEIAHFFWKIVSNEPLGSDILGVTFGDASVEIPNELPRPKHWPTWKLSDDSDTRFSEEWTKWREDRSSYVPPVR